MGDLFFFACLPAGNGKGKGKEKGSAPSELTLLLLPAVLPAFFFPSLPYVGIVPHAFCLLLCVFIASYILECFFLWWLVFRSV